MLLVIHTDGGSRGNPGLAAYGFTVHNKNNELLFKENKYIGIATNNVAEYAALRASWDWIMENTKKLDVTEVDFFLDSELVVKQMKGEYKIKDQNLFSIAKAIKNCEKSQSLNVKYIHIPRAQNSEADSLVNAALDAEIAHSTSTGK